MDKLTDIISGGYPLDQLNITLLLQFMELHNLNISTLDMEHILQNLNIQSLRNHVNDNEHILMTFLEYRIYKSLSMYAPPVLLLVGMFGNVMSFLILRNKTMARISTNLFLAALAVADTIVLMIGLLRKWLAELTTIDAQNEASWLCKTINVLGYSSSQFSVWLIIAVTIERYVVVSQPLHASRFCNLTKAKRVIGLLALVFLVINMHFLWTADLRPEYVNNLIQSKRCDCAAGFEYVVKEVWPWIDALLYCLLPFLLISAFNFLIIHKTVRATTWRGEHQNGSLIKLEKRKSAKDNNFKITLMLLAVSFTFLVTTLPMGVVMIAHNVWNQQQYHRDIHDLVRVKLFGCIADLLMYVNHSVNFYLYCALGQKFRTQVVRTVCGRNSSTVSNISDHSQHLYCSRKCVINGFHVHKGIEETAV
ncbi:hypothetical protein ACJMK2_009950 [Sinanodonta woodiana]|uniref:G-protein coupled receptors family 1 profile domain-containing protein n=1 Tax=Sinanodonta woodiana TaxID=1069815 RepID=A0ABD3VDW3_SINWO